MKPMFNADHLRQQLRMYDRTPFMDVLQVFLNSMPSVEAIENFADRYPDKWAQAIGQIAKTAGFTEKKELTVDLLVGIREMSDSAIEDKLRELLTTNQQMIDMPSEDLKQISVQPTETKPVLEE
jgi:hypothetical protein